MIDQQLKEKLLQFRKKLAVIALAACALSVGGILAWNKGEPGVAGTYIAFSLLLTIILLLAYIIVVALITGVAPYKRSNAIREKSPFDYWMTLGFYGCLLLAFLLMALRIFNVPFAVRIINHLPSQKTGVVGRSEDLLRRGKYQELSSLAQRRLTWNADDPHGHYYRGLAAFYLKDWDTAALHIRRVQQLEPSWHKDALDAYLIEIEKRRQERK